MQNQRKKAGQQPAFSLEPKVGSVFTSVVSPRCDLRDVHAPLDGGIHLVELGMVGRQWVVKDPSSENSYLMPCLSYLCETTGMKLRFREKEARGICVWASYSNGKYWQSKCMHKSAFYTNQEIYRRAMELFNQRPNGHIRTIGIYCYRLEPSHSSQLSMFEDVAKKDWLTKSVDEINDFYGTFTVHSATTLYGAKIIKQKIPFGGTEYFELLLKHA